jgi:voltage-gated potassium channel
MAEKSKSSTPKRHWNPGVFRYWPRDLTLGISMLVAWILAGTAGFVAIEGWTPLDAFYMTVTTVSTVGYGEIHPLSSRGRLFASVLIIGAIGTAIYTFTRLGQAVVQGELLGGLGRRRMRRQLMDLEDHFVLCGFGRFAKPVAEELAHKKIPFCVIERDAGTEPQLRDAGYVYLIDDATTDEALQDAGVDRARAVLALLPSDADNLYVTVTARSLNPGLRVIARSSDERGESKLRRGGADVVVSPYNLAGTRIVQAATSPTVLQFVERVADRQYLEMNLAEALVREGSKLPGTIGSARLRSEHGVIVVAIKRNQTMLFTPGPSEELRPGDVLVIMGREEDLKKTERLLAGG